MAIADGDRCVLMANGHIREAKALRENLLAVLFPHGGTLPSEMLQSRVRVKLKALTTGIEQAILPSDSQNDLSWPILSESGLLREGALIDFALARIAEDAVASHLRAESGVNALQQLPVQLLGHDNGKIADLAKRLLHAAQMTESQETLLYHRLDSELLHLLCWRVAAALIELKAADGDIITGAANAFLAQHDNHLNPSVIARKLIFFLGNAYSDVVCDPRQSGLHMFVAGLARTFDLPDDLIMRFMDSGHAAPLMLLLKGLGLSAELAEPIIAALGGKAIIAMVPEFSAQYHALDPVEARAAICAWNNDSAL